MDVKIKIKEINIAREGAPKMAKECAPKMARIGDYWFDQQTTEIIDLLKEYQDVFARDYKDLKGLLQEMGEVKIDF